MRFLNPIWFWGALGAAGVAIPIIIHIFSRYRSQPVDWAAMELLRRAMAVRARRLRMEDLILLLLRCLAVGLIALALSRPTITPPSTMRWAGGFGDGARAGAVIALDGSFSMSHKPGVRSRFDLAVERVHAVLDTMSAGDPVTLVVLGSRPRIVLRNVAYEAERVDAALKTLKPLAEPLDLEVCLEELKDLVREIKAPTKECYMVTDAQAATWEDVSDGARASLRELRALGTVFMVPAGAQSAENLAITKLAVASGILRRGALARYEADVRNTGTQPARDVTVRLVVNGMPVDKRTIDAIAPGQTAVAPLFALFDRKGIFSVEAAIGDDSLPIDNTRYLVADIRDEVKVLCVDGDPSQESFRGETDFLVAALQPDVRRGAAEGVGGVAVTTVPYDSLRISVLSGYDVVILANVPELIREQSYALGEFVRAGGGLLVFLGEKTSPSLTNLRMRCADGSPLLPASLLDMSEGSGDDGPSKKSWTIDTTLSDHPVARVFATMPVEQWSGIRFNRYIKTTPNKGARVILRLVPGEAPLLLSQSIGHGQVMLFTSTADRAWTDMVVHPAYLMMVQQAITTLTRKSHETPVAVSQPLVFELPAEGTLTAVTVVDPARQETQVGVAEQDGRKTAVVTSADLPGVYALKWDAETPVPLLAANVDPAESSLRVLRGEALAVASRSLSMRVIEEGDDVAAAVRDSRVGHEIWHMLMIMALCALLLETLLARWFVRKMTDVSDVETTSRGIVRRTPREAAPENA